MPCPRREVVAIKNRKLGKFSKSFSAPFIESKKFGDETSVFLAVKADDAQ
jgi:hypothetical protein